MNLNPICLAISLVGSESTNETSRDFPIALMQISSQCTMEGDQAEIYVAVLSSWC